MLAVSTRDEWAFSLIVNVGGFGAATYVNAATDNDAQLASAAFLAWLNGAGRPWAGGATWTRTYARSGTSGVLYTFACGKNFTLTGGAATCLGLAAGAYVNSVTSTTDAAGAWYPKVRIAVRDWARFVDSGDAAAAGAVRPGSPGAGSRQVTIEALATATDAAKLAYILGQSSTPRTASVYQVHLAAWRKIALGEVQRSRTDTTYRFEFSAAGI